MIRYSEERAHFRVYFSHILHKIFFVRTKLPLSMTSCFHRLILLLALATAALAASTGSPEVAVRGDAVVVRLPQTAGARLLVRAPKKKPDTRPKHSRPVHPGQMTIIGYKSAYVYNVRIGQQP